MGASGYGHPEIAKLLIEAGADVNVQDNKGYTALMWASKKGYTDIANLLREAGAKEYLYNYLFPPVECLDVSYISSASGLCILDKINFKEAE